MKNKMTDDAKKKNISSAKKKVTVPKDLRLQDEDSDTEITKDALRKRKAYKEKREIGRQQAFSYSDNSNASHNLKEASAAKKPVDMPAHKTIVDRVPKLVKKASFVHPFEDISIPSFVSQVSRCKTPDSMDNQSFLLEGYCSDNLSFTSLVGKKSKFTRDGKTSTGKGID